MRGVRKPGFCEWGALGLSVVALTAGAAPAAQTGPTSATNAARVEPERPISLQEAIQLAWQNQASVAVAEESLDAARYRVREVRTGTLPRAIGQIGYAGRGNDELAGLFGSARAANSVRMDLGLQPRFGLTFPAWDGGLTRQSVKQARANVDGSQAGVTTARNNLAFNVTSNYILQLRAERRAELRKVQVRLAEEQLRSVDAKISIGQIAPAERALPLSELRNRQFELNSAENGALVAANTLRNAMGLPVGKPLKLVEIEENREPLLPIETLRAVALRQRPEVAQDLATVKSSQASISIARIGRKPRLDTNFSFNLTPNDVFTKSDWAFSAMISMPLWDAGVTHYREQQSRSQAEIAQIRLEQTRKDVTADVEEAYLNLVNARARQEVSRLAVAAAQVNLEATTARYEQGIANTDVISLIQAQVQFATANNNAIEALYDIHLAQAALARATGKY